VKHSGRSHAREQRTLGVLHHAPRELRAGLLGTPREHDQRGDVNDPGPAELAGPGVEQRH
jgi:hypothetical protein